MTTNRGVLHCVQDDGLIKKQIPFGNDKAKRNDKQKGMTNNKGMTNKKE
jgi:hypothetical protein